MKLNERFRWGTRNYYRIFLAAILFCVSVYYIISTVIPYGDTEHEIAEGYFVNTSGCRMMALNPLPMESANYLLRLEPKNCNRLQLFKARTIHRKNYLIRTMSNKKILNAWKVENISDIVCIYKTTHRYDDFRNIYVTKRVIRLSNQTFAIGVEDSTRILRIRCTDSHNTTLYHDVHFFLQSRFQHRPKKRSDRLSVMIIGIDSLSHMHYLRTMPFLGSYISRLPHVEFWGYNRVGSNSYPNLVPLLSGMDVDQLEAACYRGYDNYDECEFLWKHFKLSGYRTSFAEDTRVGGTFNYVKKGFYRQPTDFYLRPVMLEIDSHTRYSIDLRDDIHCTGSRKYGDILLEFINKLIPNIADGLHFSFFWQSQGVHDYFNYAQLLDEKYLKLMQTLNNTRILNDTLVLLMSDHGIRFGSFRQTYQGMLEESQPLLIALFPKWLEKAYPVAISNLRYNAHSLVTTFDLHVTLKDLTNLKLLHNSNIQKRTAALRELGHNIPRGISLFLPIPKVRDCALAGIPASYCLCHSLSLLATADDRSQRAALFVVKSINAIIRSEKLCQTLKLKEVQAAYLLNRNNDHYEYEVKVRIQTTPGGGLFEGTTRFTGDLLALNGAVLRINKYGNQSYCVHNYLIEMYCYCL